MVRSELDQQVFALRQLTSPGVCCKDHNPSLHLSMRTLKLLLLSTILCCSLPTYAQQARTQAYREIQRVFENYVQYEEPMDTQEDTAAMFRSLRILKQYKLPQSYYTLLLNVWMYYELTDYSVRDHVMPLLKKDPQATIIGIDARLKKKYKWESREGAPLSELYDLKKQLQKLVPKKSPPR
jgi:hypothetical protein